MTISIISLPIGNLEHIFQPSGLPLVEKGGKVPATTSILIQGAAGTGKTTLAVALARAIAVEEKGTAFYLTTEVVPTEIRYKAKVLGFPEEEVVSWSDHSAGRAGMILVESLRLTAQDVNQESEEGRKRASLDAVWEALRAADSDDPPVRVAVIDAFTLPQGSPEEALQRSDLLAFVQALEAQGVSVILVEEEGASEAGWLTFVVDLVFRLSYEPDRDTGVLIRKLSCPKCRYVQAAPGPHDYGLDFGRPAVWPNLVSMVAFGAARLLSTPVTEARSIFPLWGENRYALINNGRLVFSAQDKTFLSVIMALELAPGFSVLQVYGGPVAPSDTTHTTPVSYGPDSLGWGILRSAEKERANVVIFHNMGVLLERQRFRAILVELLDFLRQAGLVVCVHELSDASSLLNRIADVSPHSHCKSFLLKETRKSTIRPLWRLGLEPFVSFRPFVDSPGGAKDTSELVQHRKKILESLKLGNLEEARGFVANHPSMASQRVPATTTTLEIAVLADQLGWQSRAQGVVEDVEKKAEKRTSLLAAVALSWALLGDDWRAMRAAVRSFENGLVNPSAAWLWKGLCALYAENQVAIEELRPEIVKRKGYLSDLLRGYVLRALAAQGRLEEIDEIANEYRFNVGEPKWKADRLKAEALLEAGPQENVKKASKILAAIDPSDVPSRLEQADILFNLGVAYERLGNANEAARNYQLAMERNPVLEIETLIEQ
jgi:KaiC/GvpD/RAD55 family RecA-like ATPase